MLEENVLGGVSSAQLKKGLLGGYGLYLTDRRIIGVKARTKALVSGVVGGIVGGVAGALTTQAVARLTRDEKVKLIGELEKNKDFEVLKDEVTEIELKKPNPLMRLVTGLGGGHIIIRTGGGKEIKITNYGKGEHELLLDLMRRFKPEAVKAT